jgi:hypothetical protein
MTVTPEDVAVAPQSEDSNRILLLTRRPPTLRMDRTRQGYFVRLLCGSSVFCWTLSNALTGQDAPKSRFRTRAVCDWGWPTPLRRLGPLPSALASSNYPRKEQEHAARFFQTTPYASGPQLRRARALGLSCSLRMLLTAHRLVTTLVRCLPGG